MLSSAIFICLCSIEMNQTYWLFNCSSFQKEMNNKSGIQFSCCCKTIPYTVDKIRCLNLSLSFDWWRYLSCEKKQYESDYCYIVIILLLHRTGVVFVIRVKAEKMCLSSTCVDILLFSTELYYWDASFPLDSAASCQ